MINKQVADVKEALDGVSNGMTLMLGGFGLCGIPENAISELVIWTLRTSPVFQTMQELMILDLDYYSKNTKLRK